MTSLGPVPARERVVTIDVLRGLALLGVLIANLTWLYSGRELETQPEHGTLDAIARWFVILFVQSKAQTLLTFLFGLGFAMQLQRARDRGETATGLYARRLVTLFAIGALHVALLWWGDVTWGYALVGFGLFAFTRTSPRTLLVVGLALIVVPMTVCSLDTIAPAVRSVFFDWGEFAARTGALLAGIHHAGYVAMVPLHVSYALFWTGAIWVFYFPWLLGHFLVGQVAGMQRWFERDGAARIAMWGRLLVGGIAVGAVASGLTVVRFRGLLNAYEVPWFAEAGMTAIEELGFLGMAAAYAASVVLLMQRPRTRAMLAVLAPVGRMPLTTYVSQSVIATFLMYGWGLGWAGGVGPAKCVGIAVAIFVVQVAWAHLWLRWFRFGPLEWVWRAAVYLKRP